MLCDSFFSPGNSYCVTPLNLCVYRTAPFCSSKEEIQLGGSDIVDGVDAGFAVIGGVD
jgi:hypothetical protein